ncbi:FAD-dependent oxidoreductase [Gymnodinialimonas sp. 2305UL16-5]|uniref:NAD(P)/FAD-dependent oxidoreductase n=1 Tax=Gymnodinialimonas mytili TaxID=3126503 RepID=UPI00309D681A
MNQSVTILGAGIVGLCCALSLAERGQAVRVIDRNAPGRETSFGNAGIISPWSVVPQSMPGLWRQIPSLLADKNKPLSVRLSHWPRMIPWGLRFLGQSREHRVREIADAMEHLCLPTIDLYRRHLSGTGQEHLVQDSYYVHAFREAARADIAGLGYRIRREKGADLEWIGADELQRLEPALSNQFNAAIVIKGQARARSPGRICEAIADKAHRLGVRFIRDNVTALVANEGGWHIHGATGTYVASKVVVAMGVWSAGLLKPLGLCIPLEAERGYHVDFAAPDVDLTHSIMDVDRKVVLSSMDDGLRIAGQAEFAAVDAPTDPRRQAILTRQAVEALPDLNTKTARVWMGQRPSFPDSLPALGEVAGQPGLFTCFGHSHYGLMMAPKSGEIVADLVTGRPTNLDLSAYNLGRFN